MTNSKTGTFINQLEIEHEEDGRITLTQLGNGFGDDCITLDRCHLDVLAKMAGYHLPTDLDHATERLRDRLNLVLALVRSHTGPDDPLRAAVEAVCPVSTEGKA
ncbi:hypothetical protein ACKVEX_05630 [Rhodocyclaceae bacterium SMB388]